MLPIQLRENEIHLYAIINLKYVEPILENKECVGTPILLYETVGSISL